MTPEPVAAAVVAEPVVAAPVVATPVVATPVVAAPVVAEPVAAPVVAAPVVAAPVVAAPVAEPAPVVIAPVPEVAIPTLAPAPVVALAPAPVPAPAPAPAPAPTPAPVAVAATVAAAAPAPFVPSYADAPARPAGQFGTGGTTFGAPASGFGTFGGDTGVSHPVEFHPDRHWGRRIAILTVVLVLLAVGGFFGVPKYLDSKAAAAAALAPDIVTSTAPATLGGQRKVASSAVSSASSQAFTAAGSEWAWVAAYGSRSNPTIYVAFDMPLTDRPAAYRSLTDHGAATQFVTKFTADATAGAAGNLVIGDAKEYASPVGGRTWCMPITAAGNGGGMCLWTNGKEGLATMVLPGVVESAAKSTLTALGQMAKLTTKAATSS